MNQGHANFLLHLGNGVPLDSPAILESREIKQVEILRVPYLNSALSFPRGHFHLRQSDVILTGIARCSKMFELGEFILVALSLSLHII